MIRKEWISRVQGGREGRLLLLLLLSTGTFNVERRKLIHEVSRAKGEEEKNTDIRDRTLPKFSETRFNSPRGSPHVRIETKGEAHRTSAEGRHRAFLAIRDRRSGRIVVVLTEALHDS